MAKLSVAAVQSEAENEAVPMMFRDLLSSRLEGVAGTEVIMSITTVPPRTTLPTHWHPGEEFAYVISGSIDLIQEGKPLEHYQAGDAGKVPLKQVHTISTGEEAATVLVFRVHETGQPGRILVD